MGTILCTLVGVWCTAIVSDYMVVKADNHHFLIVNQDTTIHREIEIVLPQAGSDFYFGAEKDCVTIRNDGNYKITIHPLVSLIDDKPFLELDPFFGKTVISTGSAYTTKGECPEERSQ